MEPKRKLRLILLAFWLPWGFGIFYLVATGRQRVPGWVSGGALIYSAAVLIYATVFARHHREKLRDPERLRRQQDWTRRHRRGIATVLLVSSVAVTIGTLVSLLGGHLAPQNKIIAGYCLVLAVITLALSIRVKVRGYPDEAQKEADLNATKNSQAR